MNRLSWDTTAPRRPRRTHGEPRPDQRGIEAEAELLRPTWDEIRKIHYRY